MADQDKLRLRRAARSRRAATDATLRASEAAAWTAQVLTLDPVRDARVVAAYLSYGTEPPTDDLLRVLHERGVRVLVPALLPDGDLDWTDHRLGAPGDVPERLGVAAVAGADVVIVPALAVAEDGTRLGQGGGSYDRALTRVRPGTPVIALLHDDELVPAGALVREPHDHPVTHVATPARVVDLTRPPRPSDADQPTEQPTEPTEQPTDQPTDQPSEPNEPTEPSP